MFNFRQKHINNHRGIQQLNQKIKARNEKINEHNENYPMKNHHFIMLQINNKNLKYCSEICC